VQILQNGRCLFFSSVIFIFLFLLFFTSARPFVGQKQNREYWMTWEIVPDRPDGLKETEVLLSFVDFPGYKIGHYSDILAQHLIQKGDPEVKVVFEVTLNYGKVQYLSETEIAGLKDWKPEFGFHRVVNSPPKSPWD